MVDVKGRRRSSSPENQAQPECRRFQQFSYVFTAVIVQFVTGPRCPRSVNSAAPFSVLVKISKSDHGKITVNVREKTLMPLPAYLVEEIEPPNRKRWTNCGVQTRYPGNGRQERP